MIVEPTIIETELRPRTDLGNAERLVAEHGDDLRFAPGLGWFAWDGRRWKRDTDGEVDPSREADRPLDVRRRRGARRRGERKKLIAWATRPSRSPGCAPPSSSPRPSARSSSHADELDADPWLFNAANGTIDLRTGELREHRRDDLLTKITRSSTTPSRAPTLWDGFLERITGGDDELAAFLQRAVGYSLTGHTSEEVLFFAHGPTATGKSSILEAIKAVLGEYAATADFETFLKRRGDAGIRNDIARLAGARFVVSVEVDDGKALAEGLAEAADRRRHRRRPLPLPRNVRVPARASSSGSPRTSGPRVNADDAAMWRRILQVPFVNVIPEAERDERVKLALRTDPDVQSAILAWAVQGCLEWQQRGLDVPACVRDYTAEYRAENDPLRDWLADCTIADPGAWTTTAELRESYESGARATARSPSRRRSSARCSTPRDTPTKRLKASAEGEESVSTDAPEPQTPMDTHTHSDTLSASAHSARNSGTFKLLPSHSDFSQSHAERARNHPRPRDGSRDAKPSTEKPPPQPAGLVRAVQRLLGAVAPSRVRVVRRGVSCVVWPDRGACRA